MRKALLASLACALVLCVSAANAVEIPIIYDSKSGILEQDNQWKISGLYGTGTDKAADSNGETYSVGAGIWSIDDVDASSTYVIKGSPNGGSETSPVGRDDGFYSFQGNVQGVALNGIFTICSSFTLESLVDNIADAFTGKVVVGFENFGSGGGDDLISFTLRNALNETLTLKSEFTGDSKKTLGLFTIDLDELVEKGWLSEGENGFDLLFSLSNGDTSSAPGVVVGFGITGVTYSNDDPPPSTPEPATLAILGLGALGAGFAGRRRFAKK